MKIVSIIIAIIAMVAISTIAIAQSDCYDEAGQCTCCSNGVCDCDCDGVCEYDTLPEPIDDPCLSVAELAVIFGMQIKPYYDLCVTDQCRKEYYYRAVNFAIEFAQ